MTGIATHTYCNNMTPCKDKVLPSSLYNSYLFGLMQSMEMAVIFAHLFGACRFCSICRIAAAEAHNLYAVVVIC